MSTQISGMPAIAEANLPGPSNVASTTNATPIVITTSAPHGLKTGDYFIVQGADDPALNGAHLMVGTITSTTIDALVAPAGSNTVGTLAGGAAGTLLPLNFGLTFPIPSDGVDNWDAASVGVAFEALADRTAYLQYSTQDGRQRRHPFAASVTLTWDTEGNHAVIGPLTGNISIAQANPKPGQFYSVYVLQNGAGGHTTTWSADFVFGSTYSSVAGAGASEPTIWIFRSVVPPGGADLSLLCVGKETY